MLAPRPIDVLIVSEQGLWPLDQGFRVHGTAMARALADRGVSVALATLRPTSTDAPAWLRALLVDWPTASDNDTHAFRDGWRDEYAAIRERVASHQAVEPREFAGVVPLVKSLRPAAIVALGQHGPMFLRGLRRACPGVTTAWYAADEPIDFHLSCMMQESVTQLPHRLRLIAVAALIHGLFARGIDGAIGVSPRDAQLLQARTGARTVTISNGVDLDYFAPDHNIEPDPWSLVFWGRLDFEPNADAACWFAKHVWPALRGGYPGATWRIVGKNATPRVRELSHIKGVELVGEVPDIRDHARRAAITILPMRCGGGIKNKLLEAAAMGLPIVASPRAVQGLEMPASATPVRLCDEPRAWVSTIEELWASAWERRRLGRDARAWVEANHHWPAAADRLINALNNWSRTDRRIVPHPAIGSPRRAA